MKKIIIISFLMVALVACRTSKNAISDSKVVVQDTETSQDTQKVEQTDYYNPGTWLLGVFNGTMLRQTPHSTWFMQEYNTYMPASQTVNKLLEVPVDGISVKIVMGTWCSDSRREVPRLIKILDMMHLPSELVTYIGVDNNKNSPGGNTSTLNIERVPTIIFYKNNVETGRIIEIPETSLEQDMLKILQEWINNK